MSRYAARKVDANHGAIVAGLTAIGVSVLDLSGVGRGCPDIAAGKDGITVLLEIKNSTGRNRVDPSQRDWHDGWRGAPVAVVRTLEEAIEAIEKQIGRTLHD